MGRVRQLERWVNLVPGLCRVGRTVRDQVGDGPVGLAVLLAPSCVSLERTPLPVLDVGVLDARSGARTGPAASRAMRTARSAARRPSPLAGVLGGGGRCRMGSRCSLPTPTLRTGSQGLAVPRGAVGCPRTARPVVRGRWGESRAFPWGRNSPTSPRGTRTGCRSFGYFCVQRSRAQPWTTGHYASGAWPTLLPPYSARPARGIKQTPKKMTMPHRLAAASRPGHRVARVCDGQTGAPSLT